MGMGMQFGVRCSVLLGLSGGCDGVGRSACIICGGVILWCTGASALL